MAFNHYAKLKKIIADNPDYYIVKINKPTKTKRFDNTYNYYEYYYRLYDLRTKEPIKYAKFQQLDKLASVLKVDREYLEDKILEEID